MHDQLSDVAGATGATSIRDVPSRTRTSSRARCVALAVGGLVTTVALALTMPAGVAWADQSQDDDPVAAALADPGSLSSLGQVAELGRQTLDEGGVPIGVVSDTNGDAPGGIDVTRVVADPSQVDALSDRIGQVDGVISAERDRRMHATADPLAAHQYGPGSIRASLLPPSADGTGVIVAVVDSGVMGTHEDLSPALGNGLPRVLAGTTFEKPARVGDPDLLTGQPGNVDPAGHGTHIAGIVAAARDNNRGGSGVAPGAQILPVRVLDSNGEGWQSDITAGILWAHQAGADIINLSLSGEDGQPRSMTNAIDTVTSDTSRGKPPTVVFAAAGNSGVNSQVQWPAAYPAVIAVAATDSSHSVPSFSSRGTYVDIAAPGTAIWSPWIGSGNAYVQQTGTSMAAPLAAGAAAILRQQHPSTYGPEQIRAQLQSTARDIVTSGWDRSSGYGEVDLAAAYDSTSWPPFPPIPEVHLPWGYFNQSAPTPRRVTIWGVVRDLDGVPPLIVSSPAFGDRVVWPEPSGHWSVDWEVPSGTHDICVTVLDEPSRQGVPLGCRQIVVE